MTGEPNLEGPEPFDVPRLKALEFSFNDYLESLEQQLGHIALITNPDDPELQTFLSQIPITSRILNMVKNLSQKYSNDLLNFQLQTENRVWPDGREMKLGIKPAVELPQPKALHESIIIPVINKPEDSTAENPVIEVISGFQLRAHDKTIRLTRNEVFILNVLLHYDGVAISRRIFEAVGFKRNQAIFSQERSKLERKLKKLSPITIEHMGRDRYSYSTFRLTGITFTYTDTEKLVPQPELGEESSRVVEEIETSPAFNSVAEDMSVNHELLDTAETVSIVYETIDSDKSDIEEPIVVTNENGDADDVTEDTLEVLVEEVAIQSVDIEPSPNGHKQTLRPGPKPALPKPQSLYRHKVSPIPRVGVVVKNTSYNSEGMKVSISNYLLDGGDIPSFGSYESLRAVRQAMQAMQGSPEMKKPGVQERFQALNNRIITIQRELSRQR